MVKSLEDFLGTAGFYYVFCELCDDQIVDNTKHEKRHDHPHRNNADELS